jgi:hypothetical protein
MRRQGVDCGEKQGCVARILERWGRVKAFKRKEPDLTPMQRITLLSEYASLQRIVDEFWQRNQMDVKLVEFDPLTSFVGWVDTLPFPLASILWSYHTMDNDDEKRYQKLIQFFEALWEYVAVILVSAFQAGSHPQWPEIQDKLNCALAKQNLSLERATFGTWVCMVEILAKETRQMLEQQPTECLARGQAAP